MKTAKEFRTERQEQLQRAFEPGAGRRTLKLAWPTARETDGGRFRNDLTGFPLAKLPVLLEEHLTRFSTLLQAGMVAFDMGPDWTNAQSNVPSIDRSKAAAWTGTANDVSPAVPTAAVAPGLLSGYTDVSKQLFLMSPEVATRFVEAQLLSAVASAIDAAGIAGSGSGTVPEGILTDSAVPAVSMSGSPTGALLAEMERTVAAAYGEIGEGRLAWVASPTARENLRKSNYSATNINPLWPDNGRGPLGHRAHVSPFATAHSLILGSFDGLVFLHAGEIEILVNPYELDTTGKYRVTVRIYADMVVSQPQNFCKSTDAAS